MHENTSKATELNQLLPDTLQRAMDLASEKGASSWLTALPWTIRTWLYPTQGSIPRRPSTEIWLESDLLQQIVTAAKISLLKMLSCAKGGLHVFFKNDHSIKLY